MKFTIADTRSVLVVLVKISKLFSLLLVIMLELNISASTFTITLIINYAQVNSKTND